MQLNFFAQYFRYSLAYSDYDRSYDHTSVIVQAPGHGSQYSDIYFFESVKCVFFAVLPSPVRTGRVLTTIMLIFSSVHTNQAVLLSINLGNAKNRTQAGLMRSANLLYRPPLLRVSIVPYLFLSKFLFLLTTRCPSKINGLVHFKDLISRLTTDLS